MKWEYTAHKGLSFGYAFELLKTLNNHGMRLPSWDADVSVVIQTPDEHSKMTRPYLYIQSKYGKTPWSPSMEDIFESNWYLVKFTDDSNDVIEELTTANADYKSSNYNTCTNKEDKNTCFFSLSSKHPSAYNKNECSDKCKHRCLKECDKVKTNNTLNLNSKFNNNMDKKRSVIVAVKHSSINDLDSIISDIFTDIIDNIEK